MTAIDDIMVTLVGVEHLQTLHLHITVDNTAVLAAIKALETHMSDLTSAITDLTDAQTAAFARVDEDVAFLLAKVQQALDAQTATAAERDALLAEANGAAARIQVVTAALRGEDPLPDNPTPPTPA